MTIKSFNSEETQKQTPAEETANQSPKRGYERPAYNPNQPPYTRKKEGNDPMHKLTSIREAAANRFGANSSPSQKLAALHAYISEYVKRKTQHQDINMTVHAVEDGVIIPSVVVSLNHIEKESSYAIIHKIAIADHTQTLQPLVEEQINGITYRDTTVWADALDTEYNEVVKSVLEKELGTELNIIDGSGTVVDEANIPTALVTEQNYRSAFLDNLILAVISGLDGVRAIEEEDTTRDIKPENKNPTTAVVADISLSPSTAIQANGDPLAEDFLIKVSEVGTERFNRDSKSISLNTRNVSTNRTYGGVSGRIDFTYLEPEINQYRPQPEDSACFVPEFIISGFDVADMAPSLTLILQLISSVGILDTRSPRIFLEGFEPQNLGNNGSRNLGGLLAEVRDPETGERAQRVQFPTSMDPTAFQKFVRGTIQDRSSIAIEVPSHGPLVGLLAVFDKAADYAARDQEAHFYNSMIVNACDVLTGGRFTELWNPERPVMLAQRAIIPTGYWIDANQSKRDSREFGYLYYSNLDNPQEAYDMAVAYDKSFQIENQLVAAHERRSLITEVQNGNFVQTDNVSRVYFDPEFYATLTDSLRDSKMDVAANSTRYDGRGVERRRFDTGRYLERQTLARSYNTHNGRRDDRRESSYNNSRRYGASNNWR